jgi:YHS domain-containing protein
MFRAIFYLLVTVVVITVLKSIVGIVLKGMAEAMKPGSTAQGSGARRPGQPPGQVPLTGELKKDPVCGTYIAAATSIQEKVGGQTFHFCSPECRDKYVASLAR